MAQRPDRPPPRATLGVRLSVGALIVVLAVRWTVSALFAPVLLVTGAHWLSLAVPVVAFAAIVAIVWTRSVPIWVGVGVAAGIAVELAFAARDAAAEGRGATWLAAIIAAYLAYVVFAVVMVRRRVRWMTSARVHAATIEAIHTGAASDLHAPAAAVAALGFVPDDAIRVDHAPAFPHAVLFRHPADDASATVTAFTANPPVVITEFGQRNAAGRGLSVCDSPMPRFHPELECDRILRLPHASAAELWDAFRRIRAATTDGGAWVPYQGVASDEVKIGLERQVAELQRRGYLMRDDVDGEVPVSWRGAARFALAAVWPVRGFVDRAQVAAARRAADSARPR